MKKNVLYLLIVFVFCFSVSCSNSSLDDCDILGIGRTDSEIFKQPGWKISLSELLQANACVMDSSGLSFVSATLLDTCIPDSSMFFNNKYLAFPIYVGSLSKFTLVPYSVIKDDTLTYHHKSAYLESYIDSLLNNQNSFETVELLWNYKGTTTKTIALFNKQTSELEYDNILFNIISIVRASSATEKKKMSRSEGCGSNPGSGNYGDDYEIVYYHNNCDGYVAHTSFSYSEIGHWSQSSTVLPNGTVMVVKYYIHDSYSYNIGSHVNYRYQNCITAEGGFIPQFNPNGYAYQYYIWAGVKSLFPGEDNVFYDIKNPGDEIFEVMNSYHYDNYIEYPAFSTLQAAYVVHNVAPTIYYTYNNSFVH